MASINKYPFAEIASFWGGAIDADALSVFLKIEINNYMRFI